MIIVIIFIVLLTISIISTIISKRSWKFEELFFGISLISWVYTGCIFLIGIPVWINTYMESKSFVEEYKSVQKTVDMKSSNLEDAALKNKIISVNRELANYKYWNSIWWTEHFYTDEVDNLKQINFK